MNIFQKIKTEVNFLEAMEHYVGPIKSTGSDTYTTEEDECPIHGGHGCFRFKDDGENSIINCFGNCDHTEWPTDLIGFVQVLKGLETVGDAARLIAKDFKIALPNTEVTATQRIFAEAAKYYADLLQLSPKTPQCLGGRTPKQYQMEYREHKESTLSAMQVGWSDGLLHEHLEDKFTEEELLASGLFKLYRKVLQDYLPKDAFIYPHIWGGKVSRFTFKRMSGKHFQLPKEYHLGNPEFYKYGKGNPIAVVEGENDLLALIDDGWEGTILATIGSLSKEQVDWMAGFDGIYHTFFDGDAAGDKYAKKVWDAHITGRLPNVHQWILPENMDIDKFLRENELTDLKEAPIPAREDIIKSEDADGINLVEENGVYKTIKTYKSNDGNTSEIKSAICNFTIRLLYVKVQNEDRSRVVRIIRNDGRRSAPIVVNSEAKVSLRHWKILVANAVDASFTGKDSDLAAMWDYIYSRQREAVVDVPEHVGDIGKGKGWIFANQYVGPEGDIEGDDDNIMWFDKTKRSGVAPKSLIDTLGSTNTPQDIPSVWKGEDTEKFIGDIVYNLNQVLKNPGMVLGIMGWLRTCAYSMPLFHEAKVKYFPFYLLWGRHGKGKSTLANWMLSMYDMADRGTTTVGQLRSGVGVERRLQYYRGLPFCIDELRADKQSSDYSRTWRGWYNRSARSKGTRNSEQIVQVDMNACLFFVGQDMFADPAMRSRCISSKFPVNGQDTIAYNWMEDAVDEFPTVGYHWIREAMESDIMQVKAGINDFKSGLSAMAPPGIPSRSIGNYAMIGYMAQDLADEYFPDYDFKEYLVNSMNQEHMEAVENDMVVHFWNGMAGLQVGERAAINSNHIDVKNDRLYVWFAEAFKVIANSERGDAREAMSKNAVGNALSEEPYYAGTTTHRMGVTRTGRRCLVFDLKHPEVPQELTAIAHTTIGTF